VPELSGSADGDLLDNRQVRANLRLLARSGLVATVEAASSQLGTVTRLAAQFPDLKIVIDHFGWPAPGADAEIMPLEIEVDDFEAEPDNLDAEVDSGGLATAGAGHILCTP